MQTIPSERLIERLRSGNFKKADAKYIEETPVKILLDELEREYRFRFQERVIDKKREIGLAFSLEILPAPGINGAVSMREMVQVFHRCVFVSIENDKVTGLSVATRLRVEPVHGKPPSRRLTTGKGCKLDHTLDSKWTVTLHGKKTVILADDFLRKRGWQFDALEHALIHP